LSKRYDHLWPQVTSFDNLLLAFKKAARGKRSKPSVAGFEYDLEANLFTLQSELRRGDYRPGPYVSFPIHEPKRRLISAAPFRDRVVHHALVNVIEPIFERQFIFDTYANRAGKGTHRALDRCTTFMRRFRYLLPMDVRQFFPSIDHAVLLEILGRTLADERVMDLARNVRAANRNRNNPDETNDNIGFRCARSPSDGITGPECRTFSSWASPGGAARAWRASAGGPRLVAMARPSRQANIEAPGSL